MHCEDEEVDLYKQEGEARASGFSVRAIDEVDARDGALEMLPE